MKRATITLPDDLSAAVETYIDSQEAHPSLTAVVQAALRRFLTSQGCLRTGETLSARREKKSGQVIFQNHTAQERLEEELLAGLNSGPRIVPDESYWERKRDDLRRRRRKAVAG